MPFYDLMSHVRWKIQVGTVGQIVFYVQESLYSATHLQSTIACVLNKTIHMKMNSN